MSWLTTLAPFAAAYLFLSVCIALILGRLLRLVEPVSADDAEDLIGPNACRELSGRGGFLSGSVTELPT